MGRPDAGLAGWGGQPVPGRERLGEDLSALTRNAALTRGLGRAYGDAALPPAGVSEIAGSRLADRILGFDPATGVLHAEAGLTLLDLNTHFLPRGFFPPVVPGTQLVTLGGMVAADVHGKNHHVDGTIGRHVERLKLRLPAAAGQPERLVTVDRKNDPELFLATLGGMGLVGHVLEVWLRLERIPSPWIWADSERVGDLDSFLATLTAAARNWPFTMGWIDCVASGNKAGRGIVFRGRWASPDEAPRHQPRPLRRLAVPFLFPNWALNHLTVRIFNELYYRLHPRRPRRGIVHPESFFFPLDAIRNWNRIYGQRGFTQHQSVLPEHDHPGATARLLATLRAQGGGTSFLCVIKDCGPQGEGLLSFPRRGVSVALDLPLTSSTRELVAALNAVVIAEGGRVYLAKDSLTSYDEEAAMDGERIARFLAVKRRVDPERRLASALWARLLAPR